MYQPSAMTLTSRHRAPFFHSECMPAQRVAHRPTAQPPARDRTRASNAEQPRQTIKPLA
jgi:hypothetical protein